MPISTSDILDARGDELDSCEIQFRQFGGQREFTGRVRTVRCREDNVLLRNLLASPGDGQVLVVDGDGSLVTALLGDKVARDGARNGWQGMIIFGCVRDSTALAGIEIGIKALGTQPRRSGKSGLGEVDVPVSFGGATFMPGAELWSDDDGVIVTRSPSAPKRA